MFGVNGQSLLEPHPQYGPYTTVLYITYAPRCSLQGFGINMSMLHPKMQAVEVPGHDPLKCKVQIYDCTHHRKKTVLGFRRLQSWFCAKGEI